MTVTEAHRKSSSDVYKGPFRRPSLRWKWWVYTLPMWGMLLLTFGFPMVSVVHQSFYAGTPGTMTYVGWQNYKEVTADPIFWTAVRNNLTFLLTVPIMTVVGLLIALLLYERIPGWRVYRAIIFVPYITSTVIMGITFSYLYESNGVVNHLLQSLGLSSLAQNWLGNVHLVIPTIMSVIIWQQLGFGVVLFLAQMMAIPEELLEAAHLDGANWWQRNVLVVIPQVRSVIEFFIVVEAITMLSWVFNYVYVMSQGGPANASMIMELYIFRNAFYYQSFGMAAAVATILLVGASILILAYFKIRKRHETLSGGVR